MTAIVVDSRPIEAKDVRGVLSANMLADGFEWVLDLERSHGATLIDARTGEPYLDMFTFFASSPLGMNHPGLAQNDQFKERLLRAALNKPSNSDVYTVEMATFVDTFRRVLGDPRLPHLFFIDGGALAVENALKVAFDWKSRWNEAHGIDPELGTKVLHLRDAFHGRSGYTLSLTNTDPVKTARFPKFDWPRIDSPYLTGDDADIEAREAATLAQARQAFADNPHDIACFIMEPIQGEGGDHQFRPEFLQAMQQLVHEHDALFILDEVQTGVGLTGTAWAYQQFGVQPDIVAFGKKAQVCGIMAGGRVDDVPDNVFHVSSRINSTWGGNLTDMVRSTRILEVMEAEQLIEKASVKGEYLRHRLTSLNSPHLANVRGRGLMVAVSLADGATRAEVIRRLLDDEHVLMLGCGQRSLRFRPSLAVTTAELDAAVDALDRVLAGL